MISKFSNQPFDSMLRCPKSKAELVWDGNKLSCKESNFEGEISDGVAVMMSSRKASFFDDKFELMKEGHKAAGEWQFCYEQQMALLESFLSPGMTVLDIGCGPALPYRKPEGVSVIGLESSINTIRANKDCDLRIFGSALEIPLPENSLDAVICIYSIHHIIGDSIPETHDKVDKAFQEFGRVLKPGGKLYIFEMTPMSIFNVIQRISWNFFRRVFPDKLDMFFWSADALINFGRQRLPPRTQVEKVFFGTSAFTTFPPAFSLPWLRVPRLIYPLDAKLYKWHVPL